MKRSSPPPAPQATAPAVVPVAATSIRLAIASSLNGAWVRSTRRLPQVVQEESQPVPGDRVSHGHRNVCSAAGRGWIDTVVAAGSVEAGTLVSKLHWSSQA